MKHRCLNCETIFSYEESKCPKCGAEDYEDFVTGEKK